MSSGSGAPLASRGHHGGLASSVDSNQASLPESVQVQGRVTTMDANVQSAGGRTFVLNQSLPTLPNKSEREIVPRRSCNLATVKVFYYAVAASFAAILCGCTLSFPSSAVLDLTDSEPRPEFKFDVRLSDVFGVRKPCYHHSRCFCVCHAYQPHPWLTSLPCSYIGQCNSQ